MDVPVLLHNSETMVWSEKRGLALVLYRCILGDRVLNARIRELCRVTKRMDEMIEEILRWFVHYERIENSRIARRMYVGMCVVSRSLGRV